MTFTKKMLERIGLSDADTLYILGDFVDRGEDGFKIIFDGIKRKNIVPMVGNHDYMAALVLNKLHRGFRAEERADIENYIGMWFADGGDVTYQAFKALTKDEKKLALSAMGDFRLFAEVEAGGRDYVLCHGGLGGFEEAKPLDEFYVK